MIVSSCLDEIDDDGFVIIAINDRGKLWRGEKKMTSGEAFNLKMRPRSLQLLFIVMKNFML